MIKENKEEAIRRLSFCIWQKRCRENSFDANNERKNWLIAKNSLYPEDMTIEELNFIE